MQNRLPPWFRQKAPSVETLQRARLLSSLRVHTVCQKALCPNLDSCFNNLRLTFMILGDTCTRDCRFCAVAKLDNSNLELDLQEPKRIAAAVRGLALSYVVITSVTRDDLADGGSGIFAQTIEAIRTLDKRIKIEVLIPDFKGSAASLKCVVDAGPDVIAHNIETVSRLYQEIRPKADYRLSLAVLSLIKKMKGKVITKSSVMLGLGEKEEEVLSVMQELRQNRCDILILGQYLAPSKEHYPVKEFISKEKFARYKESALALGFKAVLSGPLVRSSYQAEEIYKETTYA
jgi:lipoic acid synthetase